MMVRRLLVMTVVALPALGAPPTSAPATQPTTIAAVRAAADRAGRIHELIREFQSHPSMGRKEWAEVLRLHFEGAALVPTSTLKPAVEPQSFTVDGVDGALRASLRLNKQNEPLQLQVDRLRVDEGGTAYTQTSLSTVPGHTMLSMDRQWAAGTLTVQFLDDRQSPDAAGPHPDGEARLWVNLSDLDDHELLKLTFIAPDLRALIRAHPREVDEYLRPALRDLNQDQVLNPPLPLAKQVLGDTSKADVKLDEGVMKLVRQLDADDAAERNVAAKALKARGESVAGALGQIPRDTLTPEQQTRIDEIVGAVRVESEAEAARLAHDVPFLIECLWLPDASLRRLAKTRLEAELKREVAFDVEGAYDVRAKQIAELWGEAPLAAGAPAPTPPRDTGNGDRRKND